MHLTNKQDKQDEINEAWLEEFFHSIRLEEGPRPGITTMKAFSVPPKMERKRNRNNQIAPPLRKKRMVALVTVAALEAVMGNHIYSSNNIWLEEQSTDGRSAKVVMS